MNTCYNCGEEYDPQDETPYDHDEDCAIRGVLHSRARAEDKDKPVVIRTDAQDQREHSEACGPPHVYLGYGQYPTQALCGYHLKASGSETGNPAPGPGRSMRAMPLKDRYDSLAHFLEQACPCSACQMLLAQRLGYAGIKQMKSEHGADATRTRGDQVWREETMEVYLCHSSALPPMGQVVAADGGVDMEVPQAAGQTTLTVEIAEDGPFCVQSQQDEVEFTDVAEGHDVNAIAAYKDGNLCWYTDAGQEVRTHRGADITAQLPDPILEVE